jgi:hypothetical protein
MYPTNIAAMKYDIPDVVPIRIRSRCLNLRAPPSVFLGSSLFCSHFSFPNDSYGENYGHLNDKKDKPNEKITGPKGTSPEVQRKIDDAGHRKRICFKQIDQKRETG